MQSGYAGKKKGEKVVVCGGLLGDWRHKQCVVRLMKATHRQQVTQILCVQRPILKTVK